MSLENRKKIITISILAIILLALIIVYVAVVLPLTKTDTSNKTDPPFVAEGEGLYNNSMVTIYPQLDKSSIEYLEVTNEHGTYAFHMYYDSTMEAEEMRLKSFEGIDYDEYKAFTVQFTPESCDAGNTANPLYEKFFALMRKEK